MSSNLNPAVAKEIVKPRKKSESEKALERAAEHEEDAKGGRDYDPEADLAETAEQNDLLSKTPLHGNTH
jgi:hypothetical protein